MGDSITSRSSMNLRQKLRKSASRPAYLRATPKVKLECADSGPYAIFPLQAILLVVDLLFETAAIGWGQNQFLALGLCLQTCSAPVSPRSHCIPAVSAAQGSLPLLDSIACYTRRPTEFSRIFLSFRSFVGTIDIITVSPQ